MCPVVPDTPGKEGLEEGPCGLWSQQTYQLCGLRDVTTSLSISYLSNMSCNCTAQGKTPEGAAGEAHPGAHWAGAHFRLPPR